MNYDRRSFFGFLAGVASLFGAKVWSKTAGAKVVDAAKETVAEVSGKGDWRKDLIAEGDALDIQHIKNALPDTSNVSNQTALKSIGLDFKEEKRRMLDEMAAHDAEQAAMQRELDRVWSGDNAVLEKLRADALQEMMTEQDAKFIEAVNKALVRDIGSDVLGQEFDLPQATFTLAGLGLLAQNVHVSLQQNISYLYDPYHPKAKYGVAGRTQGTVTIGRLIAPEAIMNQFFKECGDVCKSVDLDLQAVEMPRTKWTLNGCVVTSVGMTVKSGKGRGKMVIAENVQLMLVGVKQATESMSGGKLPGFRTPSVGPELQKRYLTPSPHEAFTAAKLGQPYPLEG